MTLARETQQTSRDTYVDFIRACSLVVVVTWHWCFTILVWKSDGPHATNPIGFTSGMWILTWLFQVMPLFFFVGGFANLQAYERKQAAGVSMGSFVWSRIKQLAVPSLVLAGTWITIGIVLANTIGGGWIDRAVVLIISPLWFVAVYLLVILLFPFFSWLHRRFGILVVLWLGGISWLVDVIRFRDGGFFMGAWSWGPWINMITVWCMAHQLGFWYNEIAAGGRRVAWAFTWGGFFALAALVYSGVYPGSMVGVPGDKFSNMAPPTVTLVALVIFQVGIIMLLRPTVLRRLQTRERWARFNETLNRYSMPLFLFHTTGFAIAVGIGLALGIESGRHPNLQWWLFRPLSFAAPLLCTLPLMWLFGRRWTKAPQQADATS